MISLKFKTSKPLILASASPRRKELLTLLGVPFEVETMEVDELSIGGSSPAELVCNIAIEKGLYVAERNQHAIVISADTMVFLDDEPLGKPKDSEMALDHLRRLSGRTHTVITAVAIFFDGICSMFFEKTKVTFYSLSEQWIHDYVATGDCFDKAGAYGIQTQGSLMVEHINGDYNSVVGLPVAALYREMKNLQLIELVKQGARYDN
ncbi:nucleoside triphosphate pyrophosphatase [Paenisporosarcina sp. TG20]|uniref:Maf family protein n=1 Tax=Paenisporosarcina sp. TG20 TaxID=1211706 RepID=UPI000594E001|nr:Maf family protein [Paenisporosarcina sp. TG20]